MKKLKTWQIVLLVIFYPIGICVWIYRVWKKNKLKQDAAAAAPAGKQKNGKMRRVWKRGAQSGQRGKR